MPRTGLRGRRRTRARRLLPAFRLYGGITFLAPVRIRRSRRGLYGHRARCWDSAREIGHYPVPRRILTGLTPGNGCLSILDYFFRPTVWVRMSDVVPL